MYLRANVGWDPYEQERVWELKAPTYELTQFNSREADSLRRAGLRFKTSLFDSCLCFSHNFNRCAIHVVATRIEDNLGCGGFGPCRYKGGRLLLWAWKCPSIKISLLRFPEESARARGRWCPHPQRRGLRCSGPFLLRRPGNVSANCATALAARDVSPGHMHPFGHGECPPRGACSSRH